MSDVVNQRCELNPLHVRVHRSSPSRKAAGNMGCTQTVFESTVSRSRINEMGEGKLLHTAKSLVSRCIDNRPNLLPERNQAVNSVANLYRAHLRTCVR